MKPMTTKEFAERTAAKLAASFEYLIQHPQVNDSIEAFSDFALAARTAFILPQKNHVSRLALFFTDKGQISLKSAANIACPVLDFNGEKDERLMALLPVLSETMKKYGKEFTSVVYPNCGHAFFNDTRKDAYDKAAAEDSWKKSLEFLKKNLG